jgi:hypothetical protein
MSVFFVYCLINKVDIPAHQVQLHQHSEGVQPDTPHAPPSFPALTKGYDVNHKRIQRLMKTGRIQAIYPRPNTSRRNRLHAVHPYLLGVLVEWSNQITPIALPNQDPSNELANINEPEIESLDSMLAWANEILLSSLTSNKTINPYSFYSQSSSESGKASTHENIIKPI